MVMSKSTKGVGVVFQATNWESGAGGCFFCYEHTHKKLKNQYAMLFYDVALFCLKEGFVFVFAHYRG